MLLTPLLLCGYWSATMLRAATGRAAERYRGLIVVGFALALALAIDLIACVWLNGIPNDKFWIALPIMALITASAPASSAPSSSVSSATSARC